jgi:NitT/TauT family transport system substrate-binding protein
MQIGGGGPPPLGGVRARVALLALIIFSIAAAPVLSQEGRASPTKVRLAVGGKAALFYLPLTVTERLGYFRNEGLDLDIFDFSGGARALQALIGGSADVVTGAFDHTIQMQVKGQPVTAVAQLGRLPGYALGIMGAKAGNYRGPQDLKGMKIGVTAPGSSTQFLVQYLMVQHGLKADDAAFIGIGTGPSAIAAARRGEIDGLVNVDPVISLLESQGVIKVVADTRTPTGTWDVYGGPYPAAVLYTTPRFIRSQPRTVQAMVKALVAGLQWLHSNSPEEIAKMMPPEYALGDLPLYIRSIRNSLATYSHDGRFSREGAETALKVLAEFDPDVRGATVDVSQTYDASFVENAPTVPK